MIKSSNNDIITRRIIGKIKGASKGPTVVFFGGIHGNEKAGVIALNKVFKQLNPEDLSGGLYAISGNLSALKMNQRYIDQDLNRLWTDSQISTIKSKPHPNPDEVELLIILELLEKIIATNSGPFYFIDFHTTSSETIPFITINDVLINRNFAKQFPVPTILGIEEYLEGPLLSYINQLGYVSLGFEAGQHEDKISIINCESFIYLTLLNTRALEPENIIGLPIHFTQLQSQTKDSIKTFEVVYLHRIKNEDCFSMFPGFKSFQAIKKGEVLGKDKSSKITSKHKGRIFMPLYQTKGNEGYFVIRAIKPIFLQLSKILRNLKTDNLLVLLPGVSWETKNKDVLRVNLKVAKYLAKSIFHLLGYRNQEVDATHLRLYNRERAAKRTMYSNTQWY